MGKRVDFSARTVITPDPNLEIDQVCLLCLCACPCVCVCVCVREGGGMCLCVLACVFVQSYFCVSSNCEYNHPHNFLALLPTTTIPPPHL